MKRFIPLLIASYLAAAPASDSDFDGVPDSGDRCPGTPFSERVDAQGCSTASEARSVFEVSLGGSYSTGEYGTGETIDSYSGDFAAAFYGTHFFAGVATSYYFKGAYDPTVSGTDTGGFSDLYLNAGYAFYTSDHLVLTPALQLKLPTANKDLGTGETDIGASLQALNHFKRFDLFVFLGYTITGDTPVQTYNDIAFGSVGAAYTAADTWYASLSFDVSESYLPGDPALTTLSFYGSAALDERHALRLYYSAGLSETAAQHALSLMFVTSF